MTVFLKIHDNYEVGGRREDSDPAICFVLPLETSWVSFLSTPTEFGGRDDPLWKCGCYDDDTYIISRRRIDI